MKRYKREYYDKNADKINAMHKEIRRDNIERFLEVEAAKRLANSSDPEALLKKRTISAFDTNKRYLHVRTLRWKISAKKRKLGWSLTLEVIEKMLEAQNGECYYTGLPLVLGPNSRHTVSLDRLDSTQGYILSNVVLCCTFVNLAKLDMTVSEFREMVTRLHKRRW
jgi:hypothetical protein